MELHPKFKVGDLVECVEGKLKGQGWELSRQFRIVGIKRGDSTKEFIYWRGLKGKGVYEDSLELVTTTLKRYKEGYYEK